MIQKFKLMAVSTHTDEAFGFRGTLAKYAAEEVEMPRRHRYARRPKRRLATLVGEDGVLDITPVMSASPQLTDNAQTGEVT